jgi:hypothetical protein
MATRTATQKASGAHDTADVETIKMCVDRVLPPELRAEAAQNAIAENPDNLPPVRGVGVADVPIEEMAVLIGKKWKNGRTLRVRFLDGDPGVQQKVQPFAHEWSKYANITLEFGNDPNAEIRISFKQPGSWSYIGTDALSIAKTQPTMNYGWLTPTTASDEYSRVVIHEFGHALGCIHEHQNPTVDIPWDKEAVYRYYGGPPNNWPRATVDQNIFRRYSKGDTQFSAFDTKSIMLYAIDDKLTLGNYSVGWNKVLSPTDKTFIAKTYPKP